MEGTVVRLKETERYGFIKVRGGKDRFFHATDLSSDLPFETLVQLHGGKVPVAVRFEDSEGRDGKGPRATSIRLAS